MRQRLAESNRRYLAGYRDEAGIMGVIEQVSRYDDEVRRARLTQQAITRSRPRTPSGACNGKIGPIRSSTR